MVDQDVVASKLKELAKRMASARRYNPQDAKDFEQDQEKLDLVAARPGVTC